METVNEARHIFYYSLRDIPATLEKIGRECLRTFNVKERFFHIEFFQTAADQYVSLEVNMRPPGGYTTDMFNYACDIDIYRTWADLLVHNRTDLNYKRDYHCSNTPAVLCRRKKGQSHAIQGKLQMERRYFEDLRDGEQL